MSLIDTRPVAATTKLAVPCASLTYGIVCRKYFAGQALGNHGELEPKGSYMATCTDLIVCHFQEIKSAQEAEIQNREEVGMDLDDEASNLGGLIEQPALRVAQEQRQEEDESLAPAAAKKLCSDASGNSAQLHCQDIDFANSNFFSGQVGFS